MKNFGIGIDTGIILNVENDQRKKYCTEYSETFDNSRRYDIYIIRW